MPRSEAEEHGYRASTLGRERCGNCRHADDDVGRSGRVWCRMFEFWAGVRGVCDEWEGRK